jgi:pyruvate dehydrogenase kinase 2/3/4
MQKLPYVVVTNPHLSVVYELYYKAFETLRRVPLIKTVKDNDEYCKTISGTLKEHLAVIPNLVIGVLECQDLVQPETMEDFINTMLRAVRYLLPLCFRRPLLI